MKLSAYSPALLLALFMFVAIGLLLLIDKATEEQRRDQTQAALTQMLQEVAPIAVSSNQTWQPIPYTSPSKQKTFVIESVYPVSDDTLSGYVIRLAVNGYNGKIRLLIGVDTHFALNKLRIISHSETPGLGDRIELRKSDWIRGFDHLPLGQSRTPQEQVLQRAWHLQKYGGNFDNLTGATITAQAILRGVYDALLYLQAHPPLSSP